MAKGVGHGFFTSVVPREGPRYDFLNHRPMRIALSYHGGDSDYDAYPEAVLRRSRVLGIAIDTVWLAGKGRPTQAEALGTADALVLTGGPDVEPHRYGYEDAHGICKADPARDVIEWEILERLQARPVPTLAICRGAQILNVFHGGTLVPDLGAANAVHRRDGEERRFHDVSIRPGTRLHAVAGALGGLVNSSHHQAVNRLADGFRVSAVSHDGVVEAFEAQGPGGPFMLAVQWHPESMDLGLPLGDGTLDVLLTIEH